MKQLKSLDEIANLGQQSNLKSSVNFLSLCLPLPYKKKALNVIRCSLIPFSYAGIKVYHEFHETCHSVTFIVLVNSHQR